jgi:hypothetical protein
VEEGGDGKVVRSKISRCVWHLEMHPRVCITRKNPQVPAELCKLMSSYINDSQVPHASKSEAICASVVKTILSLPSTASFPSNSDPYAAQHKRPPSLPKRPHHIPHNISRPFTHQGLN